MKIINETNSKKVKCRQCGCVFEFDDGDTAFDYRTCLTVVQCPGCGRLIDVHNGIEIKKG